LDPFWNAFLLGTTLAIAKDAEQARIPVEKNVIFSYRLGTKYLDGQIFREDITWQNFIQHSIKLSEDAKYVVICDIADCYQRISHHRLENALVQLADNSPSSKQIMEVLKNFSNTKSYGLPVGGPAARLLVELVLNLTDQVLKSHKVRFCRYADDYHLFVDREDDAYDILQFISEKFFRNDGLTLQKSKTRILSSAEYRASHAPSTAIEGEGKDAQKLFSLKLRYDPYSLNAPEKYEELRNELKSIDILGLLNLEMSKTRVHSALAKKLISAVRHLDQPVQTNAILALLESLDALYPLFPVLAVTIKSAMPSLLPEIREKVCASIRERIIKNAYLLNNELHAAYAARILAEVKSADNQEALVTLYSKFKGPLVRRDVILIMGKWKEFPFLSDQINEYAGASAWEKRALIVASYAMKDAGKHWREYMVPKFSPFDLLVRDWAAAQPASWTIPI